MEAQICTQDASRNFYLFPNYEAEAHRFAAAEASAVAELEEEYVAKCNMANSHCPFRTEEELRQFSEDVPVALLTDNEQQMVDRLRHAVNVCTTIVGEEL